MRLPADTQGQDRQSSDPTNITGLPPPTGGGPEPAGGSDPGSGQKGANNQTTTASAPAAGNTSYQAVSNRYVAKLIYLPDYSKPMAVSETTGIGTVNLAANLQDGWQLTSLQGSADSKVAETLTALASLVSAATGAATGTGAAKPSIKAPGGPGAPPPAPESALAPGLYAFDYGPDGALNGLCLMTAFDPGAVTVKRCAQAVDQNPPAGVN
jgi:hypothetical protein